MSNRKRECGESRKKQLDSIRLNPKCCNKSVSSYRASYMEEGSTTIGIKRGEIPLYE